MSMTDPIADMLTRIRNGQRAGKASVSMAASKLKQSIAKVLTEEGYIGDVTIEGTDAKPVMTIALRYYQGKPVIEGLERTSRPSRREYQGKDSLPTVIGGLGVSIVSTSQGVMADRVARAQGHGGEVLCTVW